VNKEKHLVRRAPALETGEGGVKGQVNLERQQKRQEGRGRVIGGGEQVNSGGFSEDQGGGKNVNKCCCPLSRMTFQEGKKCLVRGGRRRDHRQRENRGGETLLPWPNPADLPRKNGLRPGKSSLGKGKGKNLSKPGVKEENTRDRDEKKKIKRSLCAPSSIGKLTEGKPFVTMGDKRGERGTNSSKKREERRTGVEKWSSVRRKELKVTGLK